ncbi:uncharacterized protein BDZ99DRAFT_201500 [Mytilinidion resinicola]|uniref:Uncharacterized protein n=1 Tax=Mytilinidion resinicola TaxID=574789 RepID=A0A6A6Y349_9PEZI|nr:uncharacterized protein BDZ99DRAFT_201500 [Mytilinidion resinicola]KAF2802645.1 hypothetical protein BDZ99DRAFT_201500 [Mytilinidion resinicola]
MANRLYISLPAPCPAKPANRRPPLTPSTVSAPSLSACTPTVSRRDSGSGSPTKATSLLAKVASHPSTPRRGMTPASSPLPSPTPKSPEEHDSPLYEKDGRPMIWRHDSARHFHRHQSQDGYISFPDFEKFCQTQEYQTRDEHQNAQRTAVKT